MRFNFTCHLRRTKLSRFIIASLLCTLGSGLIQADTADGWTNDNLSTAIQTCHSTASAQVTPQYKELLLGRMLASEYEAFMVINNEELALACQCIINRVASQFSFEQFSQNDPAITDLMTTLLDDNGACATDTEALVEKISRQMSGTSSGK